MEEGERGEGKVTAENDPEMMRESLCVCVEGESSAMSMSALDCLVNTQHSAIN